MSAAERGALFLDRDGTIIVDEHYLNDASRVALLPGAARAIARANSLGVPVVIVTNQSGIARGIITEAQYFEVAARLEGLLADEGASVLATYYCPDAATVSPSEGCRKPSLAMYQQAATEHALDLSRSAYIGDKWRDVEPALRVSGFGVLVPTTGTPAADLERAVLSAHTAPDIEHAVSQALAWMRAGT